MQGGPAQSGGTVSPLSGERLASLPAAELSRAATVAEKGGRIEEATDLRALAYRKWRSMPSLGNEAQLEDLRCASLEAEKLGRLYLLQGKLSLSSESLKDAFDIHQALTTRTDARHIALLQQRGTIELLDGMRDAALELFAESLARSRAANIGSAGTRAGTLFLVASLHKMSEREADFNQTISEAFLELGRLSSEEEKKGALRELATVSTGLLGAGCFEAAEKVLEIELQFVGQLGAIADYQLPGIQERRSQAQLLQGRHGQAIDSAEERLKLLRGRFTDVHPEVIEARTDLAQLMMLAKNPMRAEALAEQNVKSLEAARERFPAAEIAKGYLRLAGFRLANCKVREAELMCEKAVPFIAPGDHEQSVALLALKAGLARLRGKSEEALSTLNEALTLTERHPAQQEAGVGVESLLQSKAGVLISKGEYADAAACLDLVEERLSGKMRKFSPYEAHLLNVRGDLAAALGQQVEAGRYYLEAWQKLCALPHYRGTVVEVPFLIDLAGWEIENGDPGEALTRLTTAKSILEEGGRSSHVAMIGVLQQMASAHSALGDDEAARQCQRELATVYADIQFMNDGDFLDKDDRPDLWDLGGS